MTNFKSIADAELAPCRITVVTGANSSGKSSLLQAVLFFAQSYGEPATVTNGDLVRLGEATDVIRDEATDVALEFRYGGPSGHALRLTLDNGGARAGLAISELSLSVDNEPLLVAVRAVPPQGITLGPGEQLLALTANDNRNEFTDTFVVVSGVTPTRIIYKIESSSLSELVYAVLAQVGFGRQVILSQIIQAVRQDPDAQSELELLTALERRFGAREVVPPTDPALDLIFERVAQYLAPGGFRTEQIAVLPGIVQGAGLRQPDVAPEQPRAFASELRGAMERAARLAAATIYLGPLRDDPRVAYPLGHTISALPVGEKGEFTAAYLLDNASEWLTYGLPEGQMRSGSLSIAVKTWCRHLGIADEIEVAPMGKLGHQLRFEVGGHLRDPTAIGVGASQLLPVVVLVLGAPRGALILLEQPELHLHPKVQSRLADFFSRARPDVRLVIETHSEYLLTRLRVRVAEESLSPADVAVLFATRRRIADEGSKGYTEFETLGIDGLGDLARWPEEFFDSLNDDGVALAEAVSRRIRGDSPAKPA